jgi:glycosyltransferase involved in cell wall biosynthesis
VSANPIGAAGTAGKLTVILPVKNVAGIIEDCLQSLSWADEVILADGQSTDGTHDIAARFSNARIVQHPSKDIRVVVGDTEREASYSWIFWFCADEVCTPELGAEIKRRTAEAPADVTHFMVPSKIKMFGVNFGEGMTFPRLWRKGSAKFPLKQMHEMPDFVGRSESLSGYYWHVDNPNIRTIMPKFLRYEYVDAQHASDDECRRVPQSFFRQLARFNYYAIRTYWPHRKLGVAAALHGLTIGMGQLIRHLMLIDEARIRAGETIRDTHGWG